MNLRLLDKNEKMTHFYTRKNNTDVYIILKILLKKE